MHTRHNNGLVGELKAATYFAEQGYEIYWPALTQSAVDFIAVKGSETLKIQVKNAYWMSRPSGARYLQVTTRKGVGGSRTYSELDCDYVVCVHEESIWAFPVSVATLYRTINLEKGQDIRKSKKNTLDVSIWKVK